MCPDLRVLKSFKIFPRMTHFDYTSNRYFVYVYLNPFIELQKGLRYAVNNKEYCFGYKPLYVGKGTGAGYRHNQHIKSWLNKTEKNIYKLKWFGYLEKEMALAKIKKNHDLPWDWNEYRNNFVVVLETFNSPQELLNFEVGLIQTIGTIKNSTGPLVNIISN